MALFPSLDGDDNHKSDDNTLLHSSRKASTGNLLLKCIEQDSLPLVRYAAQKLTLAARIRSNDKEEDEDGRAFAQRVIRDLKSAGSIHHVDVIFSGQNLAKKCQKLSLYMTSSNL